MADFVCRHGFHEYEHDVAWFRKKSEFIFFGKQTEYFNIIMTKKYKHIKTLFLKILGSKKHNLEKIILIICKKKCIFAVLFA